VAQHAVRLKKLLLYSLVLTNRSSIASAASNTDGVLDQVDGIEALEVEEQISSLRNISKSFSFLTLATANPLL
jgi:hypothetical protein